eukprot:5058697-Pleurochrysis_carterae.AAC.7
MAIRADMKYRFLANPSMPSDAALLLLREHGHSMGYEDQMRLKGKDHGTNTTTFSGPPPRTRIPIRLLCVLAMGFAPCPWSRAAALPETRGSSPAMENARARSGAAKEEEQQWECRKLQVEGPKLREAANRG